MKTRSISVAVLSFVLLSPATVNARNLRSLTEEDTTDKRNLQNGGGDIEYSIGTAGENVDVDGNASSNKRYIVRFKNNSSSYVQRMEAASLSPNNTVNVASSSVNPRFGSFLPKDHAEVMNLDEEGAEDWAKRDDVDFIELGK